MSDHTQAGQPLTEQQRRLGVVILQLLVNPDWIHRRVEKAVYIDPVTVRRSKSVDFTLPTEHESPLGCVGGRRLDYVPLAMMTKWRLANIDVRDEHGVALPVVDRRQHTPIGVAMLASLAHLTLKLPVPGSPEGNHLPLGIERELWELVGAREELALNVCEELAIRRKGEDTRSSEWRRALSTDYVFMSLAWMLACGFPLLVPIYGSAGERRVIKFGYDAYRYRPRTQWRSLDNAAKLGARLLKLASDRWGVEGAAKTSPADSTSAARTGRLLLRIAWQVGTSSTLTEPATTPKLTFELLGPGGARRCEEVVGTEKLIDDLPPGPWYVVDQPKIEGYRPENASPKEVLVLADATSDLRLVYREEPKRVVSSKPPMDFGRDSLLWWLLEEIGMTSRRVMFGLRLERSGSCHFEFEAPGGFVVTRVKLSTAGSEGRILDMSARSSQRASVYALSAEAPTRALVLANVRPRSDTMVDLSWVTAVVTAVVLISYATWHLLTGRAPSDATTILLAAPGALAAFAAQPPPEVIVSRMTAGLRYFSLFPGLVAFAAAATTMAWPQTTTGKVIECCLAALAGGIAVLWTITHRWTRRPPERRWPQGPPRWESRSVKAPEGNHEAGEDMSLESQLERIQLELECCCGEDRLWLAFAVRDRLRKETQPIAEDLIDEYLIQEYVGYGVKRPPSVFVDSGEVAPTFVGLRETQRIALEAAVTGITRDDEDDIGVGIGV